MELNDLKARAYDLYVQLQDLQMELNQNAKFVRFQNLQSELNRVNQLIAEQEKLAAPDSAPQERQPNERIN